MNLKEFPKKMMEKSAGLYKKMGKKTIIAICAAVIIGLAVLLNFLLLTPPDATADDPLDLAVDLTDVAAAIDAQGTKENDATTEDAFAVMTLNRQQARDEAKEVLMAVAESATAVDEMKQEALSQIEKIAADVENEANIESLIKAKGFEECVAVISDDGASVIVKSDGLLESEVAQISEIVYTEAGILPINLKIIESKG